MTDMDFDLEDVTVNRANGHVPGEGKDAKNAEDKTPMTVQAEGGAASSSASSASSSTSSSSASVPMSLDDDARATDSEPRVSGATHKTTDHAAGSTSASLSRALWLEFTTCAEPDKPVQVVFAGGEKVATTAQTIWKSAVLRAAIDDLKSTDEHVVPLPSIKYETGQHVLRYLELHKTHARCALIDAPLQFSDPAKFVADAADLTFVRSLETAGILPNKAGLPRQRFLASMLNSALYVGCQGLQNLCAALLAATIRQMDLL